MATKDLLKSLLIIVSIFLYFNVSAQTALTINVETAGTLPTLIGEDKKYEITDLTLTGDLNGTDIRFIRDMAGINYEGQETNGKLASLDLSGANIVSGGDDYFASLATQSDFISEYMFGDLKLTSVILPNTVTEIREGAFANCNSLTSITIGNNVTSIGARTFSMCENLTNVTLGNSVTSIGESAFNFCINLTSITIPNSVTVIGVGAFTYCWSLISITIPNSVTKIRDGAFTNCWSLANVIIGNGVTSISGSTFFFCSNLTSVTIPNSITEIKSYAFQGCSSLTSITIPNSVTVIGVGAFQDCSSLTSITIPNSVTSIRDYTFNGCSSLTSAIIGNRVTEIGFFAFYRCNSLSIITIPNNVTVIGYSAFSDCSSLTEIYSKNPTPPSAYGYCFSNVNTSTCKLYVPIGSKSAYQSAPGWSDFFNIIETDFSDLTAITPISKDNTTVKAVANGIFIETNVQTPVSVYNLSGQAVYQSVISGNTKILLNKGVYIVNMNNNNEKIIVK